MKPPPLVSTPLAAANLPGFLAKQRHRLGEVFTVELPANPPTAYCIGPGAVRQMFEHERAGRLAVHNTAAVHTLFRRAVFTLRGREHARVRAFLSAGLRHDAVAAYLPDTAEIAHRHVTRWAQMPTVALYQAARDYTMEVCLAVILGLPAADPVARQVAELFDRFVAGAELSPAHESGSEVFSAAVAAAAQLRELLQACAMRAAPPAPPSVVAELGAPQRAPVGAVVDHLLALLIAARETTASLITWLLVECALDDQRAAALGTDARDLVADPVQAAHRGAAPALRRVLAECSRLHTPNTVATRRAMSAVQLGDYTVPAGWHVAYSAPATHLLPELFAEPEAFRPQRFCGPEGARSAAGLLAFGRGAHACAGRGLAEAVTLLLAAVVLAGHRIDLVAGHRPRIARFQPVRAPAGSVQARIEAVRR
ncbi:cytochrome P450 [Nocardia abscessus]|uniref:cytochrome P450 n=1 Tax=Nocardia abscessus TaxID=120957 RepID=UPI00189475B3|nr:cytochrome P450 [Nocardia abscessus]MBF6340822.1 cytochrome P450 [Nocardia abscessus]